VSLITGDDVVWLLPPDWSQPVIETLTWLTDVGMSRTGVRQKRQLRLAPRRGFSFRVVDDAVARRLMSLMRAGAGAGPWQLPIWHDAQRLAAGLDAGAESIPCATAGYDFAAGAKALLWTSPADCEVVDIAAVADEGLTLDGATAASWPAGSRLYPLRRALLLTPPQESFLSAAASATAVEFQLDEPCDWPALLPDVEYGDAPLLEDRPSEPQDWSASWGRQLQQTDPQTGRITVLDQPGRPFRAQQTFWQIAGRQDNAAFRSLLYGLAGRWSGPQGGLWLPSWSQDLRLAAPAAEDATQIRIEWCGYTRYGLQRPGVRDIRIEVAGGDTPYARIIDSVEDGSTELLTLDGPLGSAITPGNVRQISFVAFMQLASDAIELQHVTDADGLTTCELDWEATDEQ